MINATWPSFALHDGSPTLLGVLSRKFGLPEERAAIPFGLATLINYIGTGLFYPFVLLFFRYQSGASLVEVGTCYTLATGVGVLAVVRTGTLVDRFGPRTAMVTDSLIRAAIYFSYQWIHSLVLLTILASVAAIADRTDKVAVQAMVYGLAPARARPGWLALSRMTLNAGMGSGALIGGLVILSSATRYPLLARWDAVSFAVAAALCLFLHPARVPAPAATHPQRASGWADHLFLKVAALSGLLYMIGLSIEIGLPIYLIHYLHKSGWMVSLAFGLNTGMVALLQLPVTEHTRSQPAMVTIAKSTIGYSLAFLLFLMLSLSRGGLLISLLVAGVCLCTMGELVMSVASMVAINEIATPERRGGYLGLSEFFVGAGVTLAPLLFTAVLTLSPSVLWIGLAVVSAGIAAGALALSGPVTTRIRQQVEGEPYTAR